MSKATMAMLGFVLINASKGHWQTFYTEDGGVTAFVRQGERLVVEVSVHLRRESEWVRQLGERLVEMVEELGGKCRLEVFNS